MKIFFLGQITAKILLAFIGSGVAGTLFWKRAFFLTNE